MKILFVTPYLPSPPRFGGQRRIDGLMRGLVRDHEVSILAFNGVDDGEPSLVATRAYCKNVITLPALESGDVADKRKLQLRSLASLRSYEHLQIRQRADFQRSLNQELEGGQYDVVQVEFANMAAFDYAARKKQTLLVLDEHNIEFDLQRRTAGSSNGLTRRVYSSLNWRKLGREEKRAWRTFDGVVLTSVRDQQLLASESFRTRTAVVPNGVDVDQFLPSTQTVDPDQLLFFGANNYFPNHDGLLYFIDEILPKVVAKRPNVKLSIVGPGVQPEVMARKSRHVDVVGFVDDLMPHLERAALVVVPLRIGGGTRLKIVEAMAKRKAIVSTRIGAEGIDVTHDRDILLGDDPNEFAEQVVRALGDPELVTRLGRHARELAEERYAWTAVVGQLTAFYDRLRS